MQRLKKVNGQHNENIAQNPPKTPLRATLNNRDFSLDLVGSPAVSVRPVALRTHLAVSVPFFKNEIFTKAKFYREIPQAPRSDLTSKAILTQIEWQSQ